MLGCSVPADLNAAGPGLQGVYMGPGAPVRPPPTHTRKTLQGAPCDRNPNAVPLRFGHGHAPASPSKVSKKSVLFVSKLIPASPADNWESR